MKTAEKNANGVQGTAAKTTNQLTVLKTAQA